MGRLVANVVDIVKGVMTLRAILSEKFNNTLGDDDMDDLERAMEKLKYWENLGDVAEDIV